MKAWFAPVRLGGPRRRRSRRQHRRAAKAADGRAVRRHAAVHDRLERHLSRRRRAARGGDPRLLFAVHAAQHGGLRLDAQPRLLPLHPAPAHPAPAVPGDAGAGRLPPVERGDPVGGALPAGLAAARGPAQDHAVDRGLRRAAGRRRAPRAVSRAAGPARRPRHLVLRAQSRRRHRRSSSGCSTTSSASATSSRSAPRCCCSTSCRGRSRRR